MKNIYEKDILIIEDNEVAAETPDYFLKKLGYQNIYACKDGKSGINKFFELSSSNSPPLVFLDYYLPDIDVISVFDQILKSQPETKIIVVTVAEKDEEDIIYLTRHGAYHYLQKPFSFESIQSVMNTFNAEAQILEAK